MTFTFLYVTCSDVKEANNISRTLLSKKLIACANFFHVESIYQWKGKIKEGKEVVLILKTMKHKVAVVRKEIEKIHSYEIPCITEIEVKPNEKYGKWLESQMK
ncbi:MAG: divalent-cation tolerance protein CutA [Nanoarchaeota archaeon]|nr:divalent-cation tolerance protein CutA [Nanoarchaeota archaeon]